mmetsp:Transcript_7648/g.23132  ORF Transcript_7648/g.23132 Transcript_7648/m.23132 type:complete len:351 (+) Transcript_7648:528-1580(+)
MSTETDTLLPNSRPSRLASRSAPIPSLTTSAGLSAVADERYSVVSPRSTVSRSASSDPSPAPLSCPPAAMSASSPTRSACSPFDTQPPSSPEMYDVSCSPARRIPTTDATPDQLRSPAAARVDTTPNDAQTLSAVLIEKPNAFEADERRASVRFTAVDWFSSAFNRSKLSSIPIATSIELISLAPCLFTSSPSFPTPALQSIPDTASSRRRPSPPLPTINLDPWGVRSRMPVAAPNASSTCAYTSIVPDGSTRSMNDDDPSDVHTVSSPTRLMPKRYSSGVSWSAQFEHDARNVSTMGLPVLTHPDVPSRHTLHDPPSGASFNESDKEDSPQLWSSLPSSLVLTHRAVNV